MIISRENMYIQGGENCLVGTIKGATTAVNM